MLRNEINSHLQEQPNEQALVDDEYLNQHLLLYSFCGK